MDLKTWLRKQPDDGSPMGRMISHATWLHDPEGFLITVSKGTDPVFTKQFHGLAQGLIGQFKREGGKFKNGHAFRTVQAGPDIKGDVIAFRPRPPQEPVNTHDLFWTRFYAGLLGIDITEPPVEIADRRENGQAEVTVLMPTRAKRPRRSA